MKPWLKYVVLAAVSYLFFFISQFPANKAYFLVEDLLDDQNVPLEMFNLNGSLWKGTASTVIYNRQRFDAVAWEFHPLDLLTAKATISLRFKSKDAALKGQFSRTVMGGFILNDVQANIGATQLIKMLKIPAVKLGGNITLNLSRLELAGKTVEYVQGRILWSDAESKFPQKLTLGDVFADFTTPDDIINVKLGDGGGPLELNGDLTVAPDGKYDLKGLLSARAGRQSVLGRSLGFMAKYDAKGKASFKRSGNISEFGFLVK